MIPATLHHVWVGPHPRPEAWIQGWADAHPGWTQLVWDEKMLRELDSLDRYAFDEYMRRHNYNGAANVARLAILFAAGGVYVDVDSQPLRTFDGAEFLGYDVFAAYEPNVPDLPGRVANGCIGARRGAEAIGTCIGLLRTMRVLEPSWDTSGGTLLTAGLLVHRRCCRIRILPAKAFYPLDPHGREAPDDPSVVEPWSTHFWATTNDAYPT